MESKWIKNIPKELEEYFEALEMEEAKPVKTELPTPRQ